MGSGKKNGNIWKYNSNTAFVEIGLWIQQMYIFTNSELFICQESSIGLFFLFLAFFDIFFDIFFPKCITTWIIRKDIKQTLAHQCFWNEWKIYSKIVLE